MIDLLFASIRTADFNRVWIVDVPKGSIEPKAIAGKADGNFVVLNHGKT